MKKLVLALALVMGLTFTTGFFNPLFLGYAIKAEAQRQKHQKHGAKHIKKHHKHHKHHKHAKRHLHKK